MAKINNPLIVLKSKDEQTKTVDLAMADGNLTITPDSGKTLSGVTVTKPATMLPANIKKDVNIGGVVGTLEAASQGSGNYTVKVIDYDGTVLMEKKGNTGDVIELPEAPTHDRLVFQKWSASRTVTDNKVTIGNDNVMVGATYTTASGQNEFDITVTKATGLTVTFNGSGVKDWGDGTSDSKTSHTYTAYGNYMIKWSGSSIPQNLFGSSVSYFLTFARLAGITSINNFAFRECRSLANITIPDGVTIIGDHAFTYCYSLTSITVPKGVTTIDSSTFSECRSLANITIPDGVTIISFLEFVNCYSLTNITIPESVTSIGNGAFNSCYSLTNITIPASITSIGSEAFNNCFSLTNITIPESITSIGGSVFYNCYSLTSIIIPESITSIGNEAFNKCYSLIKYNFSQATAVPTLSNVNAFAAINKICKIIVPDNLYDQWIAATNWSTYADYIYKASEVSE